jgi:hypothetical protein
VDEGRGILPEHGDVRHLFDRHELGRQLLGEGAGVTERRRSLPMHFYENVIGVVTGEDALPVRSVPGREVELVHPFEVMRY